MTKSILSSSDVYGSSDFGANPGSASMQSDARQTSYTPATVFAAFVAALVVLRVIYEAAGEDV